MAELDEMLRATLQRVAEPGDPRGVAEAIRSRLDAGDLGTPAATSGFSPARMSWLPWAGAGTAIVVGTTLGLTGVFTGSEPAALAGFSRTSVSAGLCPGGTGAATLLAGERVLAVSRSDDASALAVRHPSDRTRIVWVPAATLVIDGDQQSVSTLPVGGCLEPVIALAPDDPAAVPAPTAPIEGESPGAGTVDPASPGAAPGPAPVPGPAPAPAPQPAPPGDTTAPALQQTSVDPNPVYNSAPTTVRAIASDDVAVASVTVSWSGAHNGSGTLSNGGGQWQLSYTPPAGSYGSIVFTFTAFDAAGNASAPRTATLDHRFFG